MSAREQGGVDATPKRDHRQEVTDSIVKMLEEGVAPWQKPWESAGMPFNPTTDKAYRGGNAVHLMATGIAYRRYAIERPHMYRLMFGSTSAHGINAPAHDVLTLTVAEINDHYPSFAHVVRGVHRSMLAGRIAASSAADDATVVAIAARFWASIHGFVMLELAGYYGAQGSAVGPVLAALTTNLLVALGDSPERVRKSQRASVERS